LSLATEILIVGTGGAVRLTGSGLGCPTWPKCTPESLIPTPEMGIHGVIEFGNRMMTSVVGIVALVTLVLLWNLRRQRRDLFSLALVLAVGVLVQAVLGGITVLTGLNPFIVGAHFVVSLLMVCVATVLVYRVYSPYAPRERVVPAWFARVAHLTSLAVAVTITVGVLTTASGPHSGDDTAVRTGFNAEVLEHLHAWPAYLTLALTLVLVCAAAVLKLPVLRYASLMLLVLFVQVTVGLWQARTGLPPLLVGIHMVLACCLAAAMVAVILNLKKPVTASADVAAPSADASVNA